MPPGTAVLLMLCCTYTSHVYSYTGIAIYSGGYDNTHHTYYTGNTLPCSSMLCPLLALRKRSLGVEFVGKRREGMVHNIPLMEKKEEMWKRTPGMEFIGKRGLGAEFVGKRAHGAEFVG